MILYSIISSTIEVLGDISPLVADPLVVDEEKPLFLVAPSDLLDPWVQVVMPSLPALLPDSPGQLLSYLRPLLWAIKLNKLDDKTILLLGPRTLYQVRVEDLLPPVQTLHVCATRK